MKVVSNASDNQTHTHTHTHTHTSNLGHEDIELFLMLQQLTPVKQPTLYF